MSVLLHDEAVALRFGPYSNTSRFVVWLTASHGRVVTLIKGALRRKCHFLGQYDLFATSDLVFYSHGHDRVHAARECALLRPRSWLRDDWRPAAAASAAADMLLKALPSDEPHPEVYAAFVAMLDALARPDSAATVLHWFELRFLDLEGLQPKLQHCASCSTGLPSDAGARFSPSLGGLVCAACAARSSAPSDPVAPDVLAMLGVWQRAKSPDELAAVRHTPGQQRSMARLLGAFLRFHLNLRLAGREIAMEILEERTNG
jgi:DNA repair protein RecO (recombination protein O)